MTPDQWLGVTLLVLVAVLAIGFHTALAGLFTFDDDAPTDAEWKRAESLRSLTETGHDETED